MKRIKNLFIMLVCVVLSLVLINIDVKAASIKLNKTNITLTEGKSTTLKVTGTKQKVYWNSRNKSVAIVTSKGKVTAKKTGTTIVYAKVNNKIYKCKVIVKSKSQTYGDITGNISYYYNRYQGNKADVGAHVLLIPQNGLATSLDYDWYSKGRYNWINDVDYLKKWNIYYAKVDGLGNYYINHVKTGNYKILMVSCNTTSADWFYDKEKYYTTIAGKLYPQLLNKQSSTALARSVIANKYYMEDVTIYKDNIMHVSHDFGISYI